MTLEKTLELMKLYVVVWALGAAAVVERLVWQLNPVAAVVAAFHRGNPEDFLWTGAVALAITFGPILLALGLIVAMYRLTMTPEERRQETIEAERHHAMQRAHRLQPATRRVELR